MVHGAKFDTREEYDAWKARLSEAPSLRAPVGPSRSFRTAWSLLPVWGQLAVAVWAFVSLVALTSTVRTGSRVASSSSPPVAAPHVRSAAPAVALTVFEITDIAARVTESNNVWWRFAWRLTLKSVDPHPRVMDVTIEFQDKDGFIVDRDHEYNLRLPAGETRTFTGEKLVTASVASNVANTVAKARVRQ